MRIVSHVMLFVAALAAAPSASLGVELPPPGSTGYCLTEMDGGELVKVPLTVLGELGAAAPNGELLLVRLEGERFERVGIAAGMSGSPVYVGGELVGALAYGWSFAKEPIAGVTPFAYMRSLAATAATSGVALPATRPPLEELAEGWRDGTLGDRVLAWLLPESVGELRHLPLAVSGSAPSAAWLAEGWRRLGWVGGGGSAGAASGAMPAVAGTLEPGGMMAGLLVTGDASLAVGGTVTAVDGDGVWAFGHPFLGAGHLQLPLARAGVVTVLPSFGSSFKFFSVGPVVGALAADRQHGVFGRLGERARMVPVEVLAGDRSWSYEAVDHPTLLPLLTAYLTSASHGAYGRTFGDQTVGVRAVIAFADGSAATIQETFPAADAPARASALVAALVGYFAASPFAPPPVERIEVRLDAREGTDSAEIVDAVPARRTVRPGEELAVRVRLRHHRGGETFERLVLEVPGYLADGAIDLVVAEGSAWTQYDMGARPAPPGSFRDDLDLVRRLEPSTRLVGVLEDGGAGVVLPGGTVAAPPSVLLGLSVALGGNLKVTTHRVLARTALDLATPMTGAVRVPLLVRRAEGAVDHEIGENR